MFWKNLIKFGFLGICLVLLVKGTIDIVISNDNLNLQEEAHGLSFPFADDTEFVVSRSYHNKRPAVDIVGKNGADKTLKFKETPIVAMLDGYLRVSRHAPDVWIKAYNGTIVQNGEVVLEHRDNAGKTIFCTVYLHLDPNNLPFGTVKHSRDNAPSISKGTVLGYYYRGGVLSYDADGNRIEGDVHVHVSAFKGDCSAHVNTEIKMYFEDINGGTLASGSSYKANNLISPPDATVNSGQGFRSFSDFRYDQQQYGFVEALADLGAVDKDGTFNNGNISKEVFTKMLVIAAGKQKTYTDTGVCPFNDVCYNTSANYYHFIRRAKELEWVGGDSSNNYNPTATMKWEWMAKMVVLASGRSVSGNCSGFFKDVPRDNAFCRYIDYLKSIFDQTEYYVQPYWYNYGKDFFGLGWDLQKADAAYFIIVGLGKTSMLPEFWDVWWDSPWYDYVMDIYNMDIYDRVITGCGYHRYCPDDNVTPGQLSKYLVNGMGIDKDYTGHSAPFRDVPTTDTFFHYIMRLVENGEAAGKGHFVRNPNGYFDTNLPANRYRVVQMIVWALEDKGLLECHNMNQRFTDVDRNNHYYREVQCASEYGFVHGINGEFKGEQYTNRLQIAKMIAKAIAYRFPLQSEEPEENVNNALETAPQYGGQALSGAGSFIIEQYSYVGLNDVDNYKVDDNNVLLAAAKNDDISADSAGSAWYNTIELNWRGANADVIMDVLDAGGNRIHRVNLAERGSFMWTENYAYLRFFNNDSSATRAAAFETQLERKLCNGNVCASGGSDPQRAFDNNSATSWEARAFAPQWIEIDLDTPQNFSGIEIELEQSPAGNSNHIVLISEDGYEFEQYANFSEYTQAGTKLSKTGSTYSDIRYVRIIAQNSPSWIAYREIKINPSGPPVPTSTPQPVVYKKTDHVVLHGISEVNGQVFMSAAEIKVVGCNGQILAIESANADNAEDDAPAINAIDGNVNTIWHTEWKYARPGYPHWIQLNLHQPDEVCGLTYVPRQDVYENGIVADYQVALYIDGEFPIVTSGTFAHNREEKTVRFTPPVDPNVPTATPIPPTSTPVIPPPECVSCTTTSEVYLPMIVR